MLPPDRFNAYVFAALPDEYPVSGVPLSLKMGDAHRKEVVFQQGKLLEVAETYLETAPWISFLASLKHTQLLSAFEIHSAVLHELLDKEYFTAVDSTAQQLVCKSVALLDADTKNNIERLVAIQVFFGDISGCSEIVSEALSKGIKAFEPPMKPGDNTTGCGGCLLTIVAAVSCGIAAAIVNPEWSGIGVFALLIGGFIWASIMNPKWEKEKAYNAELKAFNKLREQYYENASRFEVPLKWNAKEAASDLPTALQSLSSFISERKILQDHYVKPYI